MRMGATNFLMKRLPKVATEMALHVLAYNLTRIVNIVGIQPLMTAIVSGTSRACQQPSEISTRVSERFDTAKTHVRSRGHRPSLADGGSLVLRVRLTCPQS
jgi:hypothetical protein